MFKCFRKRIHRLGDVRRDSEIHRATVIVSEIFAEGARERASGRLLVEDRRIPKRIYPLF